MFQKIYLEISNICNLQCTFCPAVEREKQVMDGSSLREYILKIKNHAERVCFHVMGEPLGHKQFPEFVAIAQENNIKLEITTNGTLLTEELYKALLNPTVVQVNFSVQSFFDNFPKSDPKTYIQKLLTFSQVALLERPDLYINFRLWNLESSELNDKRNDDFINTLEETFATTINRTVDPSFKKSKKLKERIYLHFDSRFEWPNEKNEKRSTKGTCYGARSHIAVHADGTVVPCCLDKEAKIPLGSLKNQTLEEILSSKRYLNIKHGFENNRLVEEFCQKCTYIKRFD